MSSFSIRRNVARLLEELPEGVMLVAAAKSRSAEEVSEAVEAGASIVGENYLQEAAAAFEAIGKRAKWHFIGHLQKNKVKKAAKLFDMIETLDSEDLADEINKRCEEINKIMPVLVEVNSGREKQKFGVLPEDVQEFIEKVSLLRNIKVSGLMTMGPFSGDPENARPYFSETKRIFDRIARAAIDNTEMKYLSMGMTNSYLVAIDEGANMVRIGAKIFGERKNVR